MRPTYVNLSPNSYRTIIKNMWDDNVTTVGRIVFSQ